MIGVGGVRSSTEWKTMGLARGGKKAHLHVNFGPTHGLEPKEER